MPNRIYPKYKKAVISGGTNTNLLTVAVKLILVDLDAYTYADAHEFLSDVPAGARVSISPALANKTVTDLAAFRSDNARFESVTGLTSEGLIGFVDTGTPGSSRLVWFQDTGITGMPVTPDGGSYNVLMSANGWFIL